MTEQELALIHNPPKRRARASVTDEVIRIVRKLAPLRDGDEITNETIAKRCGISSNTVSHIINRTNGYDKR